MLPLFSVSHRRLDVKLKLDSNPDKKHTDKNTNEKHNDEHKNKKTHADDLGDGKHLEEPQSEKRPQEIRREKHLEEAKKPKAVEDPQLERNIKKQKQLQDLQSIRHKLQQRKERSLEEAKKKRHVEEVKKEKPNEEPKKHREESRPERPQRERPPSEPQRGKPADVHRPIFERWEVAQTLMISHQKHPAELQAELLISGGESWTATFCIPPASPLLLDPLGLLGLLSWSDVPLWTWEETGQRSDVRDSCWYRMTQRLLSYSHALTFIHAVPQPDSRDTRCAWCMLWWGIQVCVEHATVPWKLLLCSALICPVVTSVQEGR